MPARILDGKSIAREIRREVRLDVSALAERTGAAPCLATVLVGNDPASTTYVHNKVKACEEVGIVSVRIDLPADLSEASLLREIGRLNNDPSVHAILVQLPLPPHISEQRVLEAVLPSKDVDGFHPSNLGGLLVGSPLFVASTPLGILELLTRSNVTIEGKRAVIVGWSVVVGKPTAFLLLQHHATVTICHIKTRDLSFFTRQADILVVAAGNPALVTGPMVKEGAVVIDVGVNRLSDGRLVGDVAFQEVAERASLITPVPGGVGPMTVAMLLKNTVVAYRRACGAADSGGLGSLREADREEAEPPLLSKEEAIAEVNRWIEQHKIDPNQIFARTGELIVRYGDLIPHLEQETDEGRLLLRAISRGQVIRHQRSFPGAEGGRQR